MSYRIGRRLYTSDKRPAWCEMETRDASPQAKSLLLRLPAEIRNHIYEYVFGSGSIHFCIRECRYTDVDFPNRNGYKIKEYEPDWDNFEARDSLEYEDSSLPPKKYAGTRYYKISHSICDDSQDWADAYTVSKTLMAQVSQEAEQEQEQNTAPETLWSYDQRHFDCRTPIYDFAHQQYASICRHSQLTGSRHACKGCRMLRKILTATHGKPSSGLKDYHSDSALNLQILQTCKQIYHEAKLLPYISNTFDFNSGNLAREVAVYQLGPLRTRAIRTLHLENVRCAEDFQMVVLYFQGLRHLRLSIRNERESLYGDEATWQAFFQLNKLESVEVIVGRDMQEESKDGRVRRARHANAMESFLMSADIEEAEKLSAESEGRNVGERWNRGLGTRELWFKPRTITEEEEEEGEEEEGEGEEGEEGEEDIREDAEEKRGNCDNLDEQYLRQLLDRGVYEIDAKPPI